MSYIDVERWNRECKALLARIKEICEPLPHEAHINLILALDDLMTLCISSPRVENQSQPGKAA